MPIRSPTGRNDATIWPHATAVTTHHPSRLSQVFVRKQRDSEPSMTGSQATIPANASVRPKRDPAIESARISPPTVAAIRESDSPRRNQYMPRPAMMGCSTMKKRIAAPHGSAANTSIAGRYIQPDSGSAANGVPASV